MIAPFVKPRIFLAAIGASPETRSRLLLIGLSLIVVLGYGLSLLAPLLFRAAFAQADVSPSDLTAFMIGW